MSKRSKNKRQMPRSGLIKTAKTRRNYTYEEVKFYDTNAVLANMGGSKALNPSTGAFNTVPQGDGPSERVGRKIDLLRWEIRGIIRTAFSAGRGVVYRVILFEDRQANGDVPPSYILPLTSTPGLDINRFPDMTQRHRYTIYADDTMKLNPQASDTGATTDLAGSTLNYRRTINFSPRNSSVLFQGTSANITSLPGRALHILILASATDTTVVDFNSRLLYID